MIDDITQIDEIKLEDLVVTNRRPRVKAGTQHPFIYSNGSVDVTYLGEKKLEVLRKESDEVLRDTVFEYLQNPIKYMKEFKARDQAQRLLRDEIDSSIKRIRTYYNKKIDLLVEKILQNEE